jgi:hypothetical protein
VGSPSEASLYHPSSRQQYQAAFGLALLDHFQLDAMLGGHFFNRLTRVALVHVRQLDILLRELLHPPGQFADLVRSCSWAGVT